MSPRWAILLTLTVLAGCAAPEAQEPPPIEPQQLPAADTGEPARLAQQVRMLTEQLAELRDRATRLEKRTRKLQLANEQLEKQLQADGDVAGQRDEYKAQAAQLQLANERLRRRVAELQKQLDALTAPATRPAD